VNIEAATEQETLNTQLAQSREQLAVTMRGLAAVERELKDLSSERRSYSLLQDACNALAKLDEAGAARLFWGDSLASEATNAHLKRAQARAAEFEARWEKIEARRQAGLAEMRRHQEGLEILEEEMFQAQQQEERRKLEWIVEREISALPARQPVMPWARGGEDDRRFRKALVACLAGCLLFGLLLPLIDLPMPTRAELTEVPERLARLVEQRLPPPPPPPPAREETVPEPIAEPVQAKEVEQTETKPVMAEAIKPAQEPAPQRRQEPAGILAFREKFSELADARPSAQLGAQARISGAGQEASGRPERAMVTTQAPGSSGGINLAALSRGGGGGGGPMAGVAVTRATSSIGGGGADRPTAGGGAPNAARSDEEIQIVFDRHKAALYRLYNRELRRDPTLRGQMVLRIRIEPDGSVSLCELQATDMRAPELSAQVLERVGTFNFGPKDVPPVTILYPIDFLPAT
jgi:outer membrane biosynthesis protein TonB